MTNKIDTEKEENVLIKKIRNIDVFAEHKATNKIMED